ncbi:SIS domain-containing protein [Zafaria sp. Z1313]|uniref:SIS domain-containing protein n=1 Tax=unclassified Zafaria TaxID=2828765 RepID=UPI002E76B8AF|nr:sugar isomerase [Zafaria sp. J156]MEE1620031.1 sugar isomerase [Zafaria sp. J156]
MERELTSQPGLWQRAIEQSRAESLLPADGARIALVGCGTSWFKAQAYAVARETAGRGVTDAFAASEALIDGRGYDAVVAITRSGTTTEVLELLRRIDPAIPTVAIVGDTSSPITTLAGSVVELPYADERSVVQTRFATTALAYLLTSVGIDLSAAVEDARAAVSEETPRELLDAAPGRVTWVFGEAPEGLDADVAATGATYRADGGHPLATLARVHKTTLDRARARGLDPDAPPQRNLTRSVILEPGRA